MKRRKFIQKGALTGSFLSLGGLGMSALATTADNSAFANLPADRQELKNKNISITITFTTFDITRSKTKVYICF